MIRFIDISGQITDDVKEFSFYDTTIDKFIEGESGMQTWSSVEDFIDDYNGNQLERFLSLIPKGF